MRVHLIGLCLATAGLAACSGGGGGGTVPPAGGGGTTTQSSQATNEQAVETANGVGTPVRSFASYESTISNTAAAAATRTLAATGTCHGRYEFFAPDTAGDPNSTESKLFYDAACTDIARDVVRIYSASSASAETVSRTENLYAPNDLTAIATRTSTDTIAGATFDAHGFPIAADGFTRSGTAQLTIGGSKTIASSGELVMQAAASGTNAFCDDTAGFSVTGSSTLAETFGWAGGVSSGGTRTTNSDGSVTWTATHAGTAYKAAIGGLSLVNGTPNATCPIATPEFALAGGSVVGTYSIPVIATFKYGILTSLNVTNATLSNGNTLTISTTPGALPSSTTFIVGTISTGSTQLATFAVNAFGNGTLTVTKTGAQFVITDWHVVK